MFVFVHKKTAKVLGISVFSNAGGEFCNEIGAEFEEDSETPFVGETIEKMNKIKSSDPEWYNSSLTNPAHREVKLIDYEIKKIVIV